jgi:hypothetical protein
MIDAGYAKAIKDNLYDTMQKLKSAEKARASVKRDADNGKLRNDDGYKRE